MADKSQSFRDVLAWQKAHAFTLEIYRATEAFPKHELFALTSQLRRAAASVASNFVEGFRNAPNSINSDSTTSPKAQPTNASTSLSSPEIWATPTPPSGRLSSKKSRASSKAPSTA